ncbi:acyl-CoA dehydrogenase family protein [Pseudomonas aeruginosa]|nr:acyl-CoA dehydrogenase family protein [Pseudomonas aeruginosa]
MDQGDPQQLHIALSKLAISEGALASSLDAVRIFGGRGCLEGFGIEEMFRDSVGTVIFPEPRTCSARSLPGSSAYEAPA